MFNFLRKKTTDPGGLERAKEDKLISEVEYWELIIKRAENKLKEIKEPKKK